MRDSSSETRRLIVYNKPPKTGSTSISYWLASKFKTEQVKSFHPDSNDYLSFFNRDVDALVQHRSITSNSLKRLVGKRTPVYLTSYRVPHCRLASMMAQTLLSNGTRSWEAVGNWYTKNESRSSTSRVALYNYMGGPSRVPDASADGTSLKTLASEVSDLYDVVTSLDRLECSSHVLRASIGLDANDIPQKNVRSEAKIVGSREALRNFVNWLEPEFVLWYELEKKLGVMCSAISGNECYKEYSDNPAACWGFGGGNSVNYRQRLTWKEYFDVVDGWNMC